MKKYIFKVNGKLVEREAESMRKAAAQIKAELLENLPEQYTSRHPLVLRAFEESGSFAVDGWLLYWVSGHARKNIRHAQEFRN